MPHSRNVYLTPLPKMYQKEETYLFMLSGDIYYSSSDGKKHFTPFNAHTAAPVLMEEVVCRSVTLITLNLCILKENTSKVFKIYSGVWGW